jgi:hypothetical protein
LDEVRSGLQRGGQLTMEVYRKPADYERRKKPSLLSIKPLFLHVELKAEKRR